MHLRSILAGAVFFAAFVINPAYVAGCVTSDDPEFTYGAQDMAKLARAASDSFEFGDGSARYRLDLAVTPDSKKTAAYSQPHPFARSAAACGNRKLYATAAACGDYSSMGVSGTFALFRVDSGSDEPVLTDVPARGDLFVWSLNLSSGEMALAFDAGDLLLESQDGKSFKLVSFTSDAVRWPKSG